MVEGYRRFLPKSLGALIADPSNANDGRFDIFKQSPCWHTQSRNVLGAEIVGPSGILAGTVDAVVRKSINFDGQPDCRAIEVKDVNSRRMLPAELESAGPLAQLPPQKHFGQ